MHPITVQELTKKYLDILKYSHTTEVSEALLCQYLMEILAITKPWVVVDERDYIYNRFNTQKEATEFTKNSKKVYKIIKL